MTLQRQPGVVPVHAGAVVTHADQRLAAIFQLDPNRTRAGVERVLDQLFDDGRRPFDDFTRRDLIGDGIGENLDTCPRDNTHSPAISSPSTQPWMPSLRCTSVHAP